MYQSILVPLDGSDFAEHALPPALAVAKSCKGKIILATVSTPLSEAYVEGLYFSSMELEQEIDSRHRTYLESVAKRLRDAQEVVIEIQVLRGEIAPTLAGVKCNLVVMATHGRGALGRFWVGSVADEMIHEADCPLLLVRPDGGTPDFGKLPSLNKIFLSLDGTGDAERIVQHAADLAKLQPNSEVILFRAIHSVLPIEVAPKGSGYEVESESRALVNRVRSLQAKLRHDAEVYLQEIAASLKSRGLKVNTDVVVDDDPAKAILSEAEKMSANLIAIETHGRRGLSRLVRGSVADKVIRGSHLPILIHRMPES